MKCNYRTLRHTSRFTGEAGYGGDWCEENLYLTFELSKSSSPEAIQQPSRRLLPEEEYDMEELF
jgi:hypothetical protein